MKHTLFLTVAAVMIMAAACGGTSGGIKAETLAETTDSAENNTMFESAENGGMDMAGSSSVQGVYDKYLCTDNDEVVFSFKMKNSAKTVSVLVAKSPYDSYITYRYGTPNKIELEYPANKTDDSWSKFTYTSYFFVRAANQNRLSFTNGNYTYEIFEDSGFLSGMINGCGILVTDNKTNKQTLLEGDYESMTGEVEDVKNAGPENRGMITIEVTIPVGVDLPDDLKKALKYSFIEDPDPGVG